LEREEKVRAWGLTRRRRRRGERRAASWSPTLFIARRKENPGLAQIPHLTAQLLRLQSSASGPNPSENNNRSICFFYIYLFGLPMDSSSRMYKCQALDLIEVAKQKQKRFDRDSIFIEEIVGSITGESIFIVFYGS
jgi:hypothetical protein